MIIFHSPPVRVPAQNSCRHLNSCHHFGLEEGSYAGGSYAEGNQLEGDSNPSQLGTTKSLICRGLETLAPSRSQYMDRASAEVPSALCPLPSAFLGQTNLLECE